MLKITEDKANDISTVIAYYAVPVQGPHYLKKCETFSCFDRVYRRGDEREFITRLDAAQPGRFTHYHISWSDSN